MYHLASEYNPREFDKNTYSEIIPNWIDGFFGKNEYATSPDTRLVIKLPPLLCLECSIWQIFFKKSFTLSITARFLNRMRSLNCSNLWFLLFFLCLVIKAMFFFTFGLRSSTFPGVTQKLRMSPYSLMVRCRLKP